jgi:uncharacterized protein (DUF2147 family)
MRHDHHAPRSRPTRLILGLSGVLLAAGTGALNAAPSRDRPSEQGVWFNASGRGAVEIRPCGTTGHDADHLCGYIVWLKQPNNKRGEPLTDGYNSNPGKRHRPICGLPVLGSLRPMSDGSWDMGWVYDPEQGQAFDAAIQLRSADRLILTGYKGVKFFSKSFVWRRAPADLPRCDSHPPEREARANVGGATAQPPLSAKATQARAVQVRALPSPALQNDADLAPIIPPRPVPAVRPGTTAVE